MKQGEKIDVFKIAKKLSCLNPDTDSNRWPERNDIIYTKNKPEIWTQICLLAGTFTNDPILAIWLLIEFVNGWRRQPGLWDIQVAVQTLDTIKQRIDELSALPGGKLDKIRLRLLGLWAYHSGYVYYPAGEFIKAESCHTIEGEIALLTNNKRNESLALYNASFMRLNNAIVANEKISASFEEFVLSAQYLDRLLNSGSEEDLRWKANIAYNIILFGWLIQKKQPSEIMNYFFSSLPENLKETFSDQIIIIDAIKLMESDPSQAITSLRLINDNADFDVKNFSLLMMSQAYNKMNRPETAKAKLNIVFELENTEHGGHAARAFIKHGLI